MNYELHYNKLMINAACRDEDPEDYMEKHHALPKSTYPEHANDPDNLVRLTAREHLLAHWLLHRIDPTCPKMSLAFWVMSNGTRDSKVIVPTRIYAAARKAKVAAQTGERHPMFGKTHTDEARAKMSASQMGKVISAEHRAILSAANKGKVVSAETRAKLSAVHKGKIISAEQRAILSAVHKGKVISAEHRARISACHLGKVVSTETRAKLSAAGKGKIISAEQRARISAAHKGRDPWRTGATQKPHIKELWLMLADVYDWWITVNHISRGSGGRAAASHFGYKYSVTWQNMIKWIRKNGDPRLNADWVSFKEANGGLTQ